MLEQIIDRLSYAVWTFGVPAGEEMIPIIVIALLGTGIFLTTRLGFIQIRRLAHGFGVTSGRYDDPDEPGDVSHFQALTTALSATVGIGNIAGVALAIHWGGPGALFWMWVTAFLGMAVKYSEVTLAQHYRQVEFPDKDPTKWEGSVSGGPMYYIEQGLKDKVFWKHLAKPMAIFFAAALTITSFLTGNGVQANTVADTVNQEFGLPVWITGLFTALVVGAVILGGIRRIGRVTSILAPVMATVYVLGALTILAMNAGEVLPTFGLIFQEAFNPSAGVAGTGAGALLVTLMWGVRRGLFSNEAGQGSAPIAHAAAKTDEPVSEGVVALLEPFIDTLVICTMTGLVILITGVWDDRFTTPIEIGSGDLVWVTTDGEDWEGDLPDVSFLGGRIDPVQEDAPRVAWHEVAVDELFVDEDLTNPFTGTLMAEAQVAVDSDGNEYTTLYGQAVESGAPLTKLAFEAGLGKFGGYIVLFSVLLFAISTAISWSYYGDRCVNYLFGAGAVLPFKILFVIMHFVGAVLALGTIWDLGDVALGLVTFPNLIALVVLSGTVVTLTKSYFERQPWLENKKVHDRIVAEKKAKKGRD